MASAKWQRFCSNLNVLIDIAVMTKINRLCLFITCWVYKVESICKYMRHVKMLAICNVWQIKVALALLSYPPLYTNDMFLIFCGCFWYISIRKAVYFKEDEIVALTEVKITHSVKLIAVSKRVLGHYLSRYDPPKICQNGIWGLFGNQYSIKILHQYFNSVHLLFMGNRVSKYYCDSPLHI